MARTMCKRWRLSGNGDVAAQNKPDRWTFAENAGSLSYLMPTPASAVTATELLASTCLGTVLPAMSVFSSKATKTQHKTSPWCTSCGMVVIYKVWGIRLLSVLVKLHICFGLTIMKSA